jgi:predicted SnoaL-like aldol condensation-catalyzing enzyme
MQHHSSMGTSMNNIVRIAATVSAAALVLCLLQTSVFAQLTGGAPPSAQEKANERIVVDFEREVLQAHNVQAAPKYYASDIIQHNPNVPTGLQGFQDFFGRFWKEPKPVEAQLTPAPDALIAKGDLVLVMTKHTNPDPTDSSKTYDSYWFDLFRVKDGKIVEHWDNAMKNPPRP